MKNTKEKAHSLFMTFSTSLGEDLRVELLNGEVYETNGLGAKIKWEFFKEDAELSFDTKQGRVNTDFYLVKSIHKL